MTVEPKKRKQPSQSTEQEDDSAQIQPTDSSSVSGSPLVTSVPSTADSKQPAQLSPMQEQTSIGRSSRSAGRELRRARIVITVRRTESYRRWLEENPLQAIIASEDDADAALDQAPGSYKQPE